jgi:hypothetical protein
VVVDEFVVIGKVSEKMIVKRRRESLWDEEAMKCLWKSKVQEVENLRLV